MAFHKKLTNLVSSGASLTTGGFVTNKLLGRSDSVTDFVDGLTGANAQREAAAALQAAQQQASQLQRETLARQEALFGQQQVGTQERFDALTAATQQQFNQQQTGIQDRFGLQQAGIQDRLDQQQAGIQGRFDTVQAQLDPFLQAGRQSVTSLQDLVNNPNQIAQTDAFKFRFNQGQQAVENSAAARGSGLGGNVLRALQAQGQGLASEELQNEFARRQQLFVNGQNSVNQLISAIGQTGNEFTSANNLAGQGFTNAFNLAGQGSANAFNRLGQNTLGASNQAGLENNNAFNNFSTNLQSGTNNLVNGVLNQGNIEAARIQGNQQNNINNILGVASIGAGLFTGNPALAIGGASQFAGTPQQSPRLTPLVNPLDTFLQQGGGVQPLQSIP